MHKFTHAFQLLQYFRTLRLAGVFSCKVPHVMTFYATNENLAQLFGGTQLIMNSSRRSFQTVTDLCLQLQQQQSYH